jgi:hypothetical protein
VTFIVLVLNCVCTFLGLIAIMCVYGVLGRENQEILCRTCFKIIVSLCCYQDSGFPCFKGGPRTIQNLRKRFHLSLTEEVSIKYQFSFLAVNFFSCDCYIFLSPCSNVYLWCFHLLAAAWMHGEHDSMIITRRF